MEDEATQHLRTLAALLFIVARVLAQDAGEKASAGTSDVHEWSFAFNLAGYLVPHDRSYASPTFAIDHKRLHLGLRYNYEDQQTASVWAGYNLSVGEKLVFDFTPMAGGVFGNTVGVAPGYLATLSWKKLELSTEGELVIDVNNGGDSFFYSWMELSYSPREWWRAGMVAQRTKAYHTDLDIQRGVLVGLSHNKVALTAYIFNAGWTDPTVVLSVGLSF